LPDSKPVSGGPPEDARIALRAWNLMGGEVNWVALPIVSEMLGVEDVDTWTEQLCAIRDYFQRKAADG